MLGIARVNSDGARSKPRSNTAKLFFEQLNITNVEFTVFFDEKLSGELRSRPGIDQVWEGTKGRCWDLLLVEDCSRLYRDDIWCVELVRLAVDQAIRVICISDEVDTADEGWEPRLKEAAQHHALHNKYCSKRIKRAHEELWYALAALGLLRPGYRRRPSILATDEHPEEGPYFDEIDDRWAPIILETFERVAAREPMWSIAEWLTLQGLPKCNNCKSSRWTEKNVKDLIRRTIYRGFETYRDHISKKENVTGKHKPEANDDDEVLTREMPHLRIVSDVLWHMANKVIDDRAPDVGFPQGREHPNYGIPRDSHGPLSKVAFCVCGAKIHKAGRIEGGYRCRRAKSGDCWNRATALCEFTHVELRDCIVKCFGDSTARLTACVIQRLQCLTTLVTARSANARSLRSNRGRKQV